MLLDPRHYRVDDLLRRPYTPASRMVCRSPNLRAEAPQGWGWSDEVWLGEEKTGLLELTIRVDGAPLAVGDALFRPSHVTLYGQDPETGLQVVEDKFLAADEVAVSVLSFRNPAEGHVGLEIEPRWKVGAGPVTAGGKRRFVFCAGPPGDDLAGRAPSNWRGTMVFAVALGEDEEDARSRAEEWRERPGPLARHVARFQADFEAAFARFDCADPWLMRLWYHGACARIRRAAAFSLDEAPGPVGSVRDAFVEGDFDRPLDAAEDWPARIVREVVGLTLGAEGVTVRPDPTLAGAHFCLDGLRVDGQRVTVVWDDPAEPGDAYHDGDKGLTVYLDGRRALGTRAL